MGVVYEWKEEDGFFEWLEDWVIKWKYIVNRIECKGKDLNFSLFLESYEWRMYKIDLSSRVIYCRKDWRRGDL